MTIAETPHAIRVMNLRRSMATLVARGELPGAVTLIAWDDHVHADAVGTLAVGDARPMQRDTIFRISSMTKPMAAAVAMMLVQDGTLSLDAPVTRWLPELAHRVVLRQVDGPLDDVVPARRDISVRDLLTFGMGFGIVWGPPDALPIQGAAHALELSAFGPPRPQGTPPPDEWMRRFATLPLMKQPGDAWMYNTAFEVLGVLLARASGHSLGTLMRDRLFAPLGMNDTGFFVPPAKIDRLATSYVADPRTGALNLYDEAAGGAWSRPPAFPSAGSGLVSTADDCLAFAKMMKNGGAFEGGRLLSAETVQSMTRDHVAPMRKSASASALDPTFWGTFSWGLGVALVTHREMEGPSGFGWDGGLGTSMWWDPELDRVALLMTQRSAYPKLSAVYREFWGGVNGWSGQPGR